jgi:hypothetical protein
MAGREERGRIGQGRRAGKNKDKAGKSMAQQGRAWSVHCTINCE